jgi:hypothetical protein
MAQKCEPAKKRSGMKNAEPKADLQPEGEIQFDCFSSVHAKN